MSDAPDPDSKTEEATPQRLLQSLEKGQVAVSREIGVFASLVVFTIWLIAFADDTARWASHRFTAFLMKAGSLDLASPADTMPVMRDLLFWCAMATGGLLMALMAVGTIAAVSQAGLRMVPDRIAPKAERLSIGKGAKRLFGKQGLAEFAKAVSKMGAAAVIAGIIFAGAGLTLPAQLWHDAVSIAPNTLSMVTSVLVGICGVMLLIAVADYAWTRRNWLKNMMMTKKEVTDEMKQAEGDPIRKSRMRSLAQDRSRNRMMSDIPTATLVMANPTHFAIALRYRHGQDAAPIVVAKGADLICARIRELAEQAEVPIFEEKLLTRAIYPMVEVGEMVPEQFFRAVADLINRIERL